MSELISAFVLHRRPYRETSFLVDVFTAESGKISFVAKGGQSAKSLYKSLLQPFQPLQLQLYGQHELKNLRAAEASGKALNLQGQRLYCGLYINELLNRLLAAEYGYESLFEAYCHSLTQLKEDQISPEPVLRSFEFILLNELGYGLDFQSDCATGQAIAPQGYYTLQAEQGFMPLAQAIPSANCFRGQDLLDIASQQWQPGALSAAKRINRMSLQPLLGSKPLKSRELFLKPE